MPRPCLILLLSLLWMPAAICRTAVAQDDPPRDDPPPTYQPAPDDPPPPPNLDRDDDQPRKKFRDMRQRRPGSRDFDRRGDRPGFHRSDSDRAGRHEPRQPLTDEQVEELFDILKQVHPELAAQMEKVRRIRPERFREGLQRMAPRLQHLLSEKKEDPELFKLKIRDRRLVFKSYQLSQQIRRAREGDADPAKAQALQNQLHELLNEHFEVRQQILEREVRKMAQRIEKIKQELQEREKNREKLIREHAQKMMNTKPIPPFHSRHRPDKPEDNPDKPEEQPQWRRDTE